MKKIFLLIGISGITLMLLAVIIGGFLLSTSQVLSDSMDPTYPIGGWTFTNPLEKPVVGDVVSFTCRSEYSDLPKCSDGIDGILVPITHRITTVDTDGCMTIVGDNPAYPWESIPCFMPNEITISGVVHHYPPLLEKLISESFFGQWQNPIAQK